MIIGKMGFAVGDQSRSSGTRDQQSSFVMTWSRIGCILKIVILNSIGFYLDQKSEFPNISQVKNFESYLSDLFFNINRIQPEPDVRIS